MMSKRLIIFLTFLLIIGSSLIFFCNAVTWSAETAVTTNSKNDWSPSVLQTRDGLIWVVWHSMRTGSGDIYYKTYDGSSWGTETQLTFDLTVDGSPSIIQANDGTIWIVWTSNRFGNYEVLYKTSSNSGSSWSLDTRLTTHPDKDQKPAIMQSDDGRIWVVWQSNRTVNESLFYKTTSNNGATWTDDTQLIQDPSNINRTPSIFQAKNGTIWLLWSTNRTAPPDTGGFDIFYKTSSDNGLSWGTERQLTTDPENDAFPSATQAKDGTIWVVWQSGRVGGGPLPQNDLFYNVYDGSSWSGDTQLTTDTFDDIQPSITQSKTHIWVVWCTTRNGNADIYYKNTFISIHDVAVVSATPSTIRPYKGFTVKITVIVKNEGTYTETFSVSAKLNDTTIIDTQSVTNLAPDDSTTLLFTWDTQQSPLGYYFISATASQVTGETNTTNNSKSTGTLWLKYPGDLNGDKTVDIADAVLFSTHWTWPVSEYPDIDITGDGIKNVFDIVYFTAHYGETAP